MKLTMRVLALMAALLLANLTLVAQQDTVVKKLTVGVKSAPPFIIQEQEQLSGVSVNLWERIARNMNLLFEYRTYKADEMQTMLSDLEHGSIDLTINPLTVTADRLQRLNFAQPFYSSKLALAVQKPQTSSLVLFLKRMISHEFLSIVALLLLVILVFGLLLWQVEKTANPDEFRPGMRGLFDGFWWSAVTMTTVGYGDKSPRTALGRIIAVIWMFTAVIIISGFTGSIAASLTVDEIKTDIRTISDLQETEVGTLANTSAAAFLRDHNIALAGTNFNNVAEGLQAVKSGTIDVFVYDQPILQYTLEKENLRNDVVLLPYTFNEDYYSFAAPKSSRLIEKLNPRLMEVLESVGWIGVLKQYNLRK